jgi:hypothetical protein
MIGVWSVLIAGLLLGLGSPDTDGASGTRLPRSSPRHCSLRWANDGRLRGKVESIRVLAGGEAWAVGFRLDHSTAPVAFVAGRHNDRWTAREAGSGEFDRVIADTRTDVWALGHRPRRRAQLIWHYDGRSWHSASTPTPSELVETAARNAPWFADTFSPYFWDGQQLLRVPAPGGVIQAIAGSGPRHAWAAGRTALRKWDGSSWSTTLRLPHSPASSVEPDWALVDAASLTDVWAFAEVCCSAHTRGISAHWDGVRWHIFPYPKRSAGGNSPVAVVAVSPHEAWALVLDDPAGYNLLRWNGQAWRTQPLPYSQPNSLELTGLDVDASGSIWLAGWATGGTSMIFRGACR